MSPVVDDPLRVGPYTLVRPLGSGASGAVHEAQDGRDGRRVALKLFEPHLKGDEERLMRRFRREAELAQSRPHPALVTLFEHGEHEGRPYLVMELIEGTTLAHRLREGPLELAAVVRLARELLDGLAALHGAGLVHRDVKPGNLMIERSGRVRILDLGLAKVPDRSILTAAGDRLGTPRYMSPEMMRDAEVDRRADLYAVGLIVQECLSGRPVWDAPDLRSLAFAIASQDPPPVPQMGMTRAEHAWMAGFLERTLANDKEERFPSAEAAAEYLASPPARSAASAQPTVPVLRPSRRAAVRAWQLRIVAASLLLPSLATLAYFARRPPPPRPEPAPIRIVQPEPEPLERAISLQQAAQTVFDTLAWAMDASQETRNLVPPAAAAAAQSPQAKTRERRAKTWLAQAETRRARAHWATIRELPPEDPRIDPVVREHVLRRIEALGDVEELLFETFGFEAGLIAAFPPPAAATRPANARLLWGLRFGAHATPLPRGFQEVSGPRLFSAAFHTMITPALDAAGRWEHYHPGPLAPRGLAAPVYLTARLFGGPRTEKLMVRVGPPSVGRNGGLLAALRPGGPGQAAERCVRVDPRLLTDPTAQMRINADLRSTRVIARGIELEELALWAAP